MLYFWNPDDLLSPNMMIDTSPWSSCSHRSPWLLCSSLTFSSTGPSVSPFRDFFFSYWRHDIRNENIGSAFFKQLVYAMDIEFYILRHQDAVIWSSLHIISDVLAETRWLLGCSNLNLVLNFFWRCIMTQTERQLFGYFHFGGCWTPNFWHQVNFWVIVD